MIKLTREELETWINTIDSARDIASEETCDGNTPTLLLSQEAAQVICKVVDQVHVQHTYGITNKH